MARKSTQHWFMAEIGGAWMAATVVRDGDAAYVLNAAGKADIAVRPMLEGVASPHHQMVASMNAVRGAALRASYDAGNYIPDEEIRAGFRDGTMHHVTLADFLCNGPQTVSTDFGLALVEALELTYGEQ
jgi:hypothetical protein